MSYQGQIAKQLSRLGKTNGTTNPDAKSNIGQYLGEVYMWEEAAKYCGRRSKEAWQTVNEVGIIPDKDQLREVPDSSSELATSPGFLCVAKVSMPRKTFSREECINRLSKKYKIDKHELVKVFKESTVEGAPSVSLKVIERGS